MSLFRVYVDGSLFYHPHMSQLTITQAQAQVQEDPENIDSLTLAAPPKTWRNTGRRGRHVPRRGGDGLHAADKGRSL